MQQLLDKQMPATRLVMHGKTSTADAIPSMLYRQVEVLNSVLDVAMIIDRPWWTSAQLADTMQSHAMHSECKSKPCCMLVFSQLGWFISARGHKPVPTMTNG